MTPIGELTDFLLARLAEDEVDALTARTEPWDELAFHDQADADVPHITRHSPTRVLADIKAKRRILEEHGGLPTFFVDPCGDPEPPYSVSPCDTLRLLALPYADHPDYCEEWHQTEHGHALVPSDPADGDTFTCPHCGVAMEFVVLDDGLPGEWVTTYEPREERHPAQ